MATTFPFLDLPPEIREKIYYQICVSYTPIELSSTPPLHHPSRNSPQEETEEEEEPHYPTFPHSLHLTCTQIYTEIRPLFFTLNTFTLTLTRHNDFFNDIILHPSFRDNILQVRDLTLLIWRWGSKEFFVEKVVPVLEDCILNGRLKVLKVVVKNQYLKGLVGASGGSKGERENWRVLRRVLGDEYLEVGRLFSGLVEVEKSGIIGLESLVLGSENDITSLLT